LKKPKLASHRCGNPQFSCIDCSKTFYGKEYVSHTSCITEVEKYQGKMKTMPKKAKVAEAAKVVEAVKPVEKETKGLVDAIRATEEVYDEHNPLKRAAESHSEPVKAKKSKAVEAPVKSESEGVNKELLRKTISGVLSKKKPENVNQLKKLVAKKYAKKAGTGDVSSAIDEMIGLVYDGSACVVSVEAK
jgi:23S rRNA maturation-related 3'-5' exoribonuclease YhaM